MSSYLGALVVSFNQCAHVTKRASIKERKSSPLKLNKEVNPLVGERKEYIRALTSN